MSKAGRGRSDVPEEVVRSWARQYRSRMLRAARGYEGRSTTGEDIVQEAFCRAVRQFHTLRTQTAIGKWLEGITKRVGHQIAKKRSRRELLAEQNILELEPGRGESEPIGTGSAGRFGDGHRRVTARGTAGSTTLVVGGGDDGRGNR